MLKLVLSACLLALSWAAHIPDQYVPDKHEDYAFEPSANFPFDYKGYPFDYKYEPGAHHFDKGAGHDYRYQHAVPAHHGFPYNYQYQFPYHGYHHHQPQYHVPKPHVPQVQHYAPAVSSFKLTYLGKFSGTCEHSKDGLYFVDERSFAFCSNGIKTIQSCAEGSANPGYEDFQNGKYKYIYDFCSINLAALETGNAVLDIHEDKAEY